VYTAALRKFRLYLPSIPELETWTFYVQASISYRKLQMYRNSRSADVWQHMRSVDDRVLGSLAAHRIQWRPYVLRSTVALACAHAGLMQLTLPSPVALPGCAARAAGARDVLRRMVAASRRVAPPHAMTLRRAGFARATATSALSWSLCRRGRRSSLAWRRLSSVRGWGLWNLLVCKATCAPPATRNNYLPRMKPSVFHCDIPGPTPTSL